MTAFTPFAHGSLFRIIDCPTEGVDEAGNLRLLYESNLVHPRDGNLILLPNSCCYQ
ncbi:hypothetical protein AMATHDRAFT_54371 [Amanita thiersii Skay4041]|uniref:Uncharacterized protein n=1 Tax=Amanita thiersii Skay4041 TaxID=703135 RepID=A0A2A9P041_9AGAR|nr:hypothetical protein AMATHDRAFT_54371 [Amanita thiersii Skay4041]